MQEAQQDTISAFEEYMDACMVADWVADKRALFDAALPDTVLSGPAGQLAGAGLASPYSPAQGRTPLTPGKWAFDLFTSSLRADKVDQNSTIVSILCYRHCTDCHIYSEVEKSLQAVSMHTRDGTLQFPQ